MNLVEDCPELFMAENPIEWAFEHLTNDPYSNIPYAIEPCLRETYAVEVPEHNYSPI
jgi:hypothetical protein